MVIERRHGGSRESVVLPLLLKDGRRATVRNLGPQGLYLSVPAGPPLDRWITIELKLLRSGLGARALGEVLRVDAQRTGELGVAVRLHRVRIRRLR